MKFKTLHILRLSACTTALAFSALAGAAQNSFNTITPGVIKVAIEPYMPYTAMDSGKLVGLDSDILEAIAKKLGLKVETQVTDFAGMLASVQSRRVDITIGGIAWTPERQKQGLFTDPPYYSPPAMAVNEKASYPTVKSLEGKSLGTVTGYVWAKSIQQVPGAQMHTYPSAVSVFADLSAGRLDAAFLDPLLIAYQKQQRPDMDVKLAYFQAPTAAEVQAHPDYKYFEPYMTGFYIPKEEPKLEQAISKQLDEMYKNGELAKLITKWGGSPEQFLTPSPEMAAQRQAVDRPSGWQPPTIKH